MWVKSLNQSSGFWIKNHFCCFKELQFLLLYESCFKQRWKVSQAQTYFAGQWQTPKTKLAYLLPCWAEGGVGKLCCEFCGTNNLQIQASLQNLCGGDAHPWQESEGPVGPPPWTGGGRGPPKTDKSTFCNL